MRRLAAAVLLVALALTGCGGDSDAAGSGDPVPSAEPSKRWAGTSAG